MRREIPYPCETHGNPADTTAQTLAWLHFYNLLQDYSEFRLVSVKGKEKTLTILNIPTLKILCEEMDIEFMTAFETLTLINRIFNEA